MPKECPIGFKLIGKKCVRKTTYKSPILRKKETMERMAKSKEKRDKLFAENKKKKP